MIIKKSGKFFYPFLYHYLDFYHKLSYFQVVFFYMFENSMFVNNKKMRKMG